MLSPRPHKGRRCMCWTVGAEQQQGVARGQVFSDCGVYSSTCCATTCCTSNHFFPTISWKPAIVLKITIDGWLVTLATQAEHFFLESFEKSWRNGTMPVYLGLPAEALPAMVKRENGVLRCTSARTFSSSRGSRCFRVM